MKLNSYQKSFVCIILFGLITLLSCYTVIKENNKVKEDRPYRKGMSREETL